MLARCFRGFLLLCLGSSVIGCSNPSGLDSIEVSPATQSLTVGQTTQLTAVGTYGNASRPRTQNVTAGVTWTSNTPAVATVDASGLVTAIGPGTATITASAMAFNGDTNSTATVTVTGSGGGGGGATGGVLVSLNIIPSSISVGNLQDTGQFLAIGTFSAAPFVRDLTNSSTVTWISDVPSVFPVSTNTAGTPGATGGVVTAYGNGGATITVEATNPNDGTLQTATATFNCPLVLPNPPTTPGSCFPGSQAAALLATLTVYNEGLNTSGWEVTAPSATGTANVLDCGPGSAKGSVCTATYPFTTPPVTVVLTAPAKPGVKFGGWSYNCVPVIPVNEAGPNSCSITFDPSSPTLNTNVTVGAIFN